MPEWWLVLAAILGGLVVLIILRLPFAFCFLTVTLIGSVIYWNGMTGPKQLILSMFQSLTSFTLLPLPLFILMGDVMFHSGLAPFMIDAIDKWLGRLPGRLSLLAVGAGVLFATLTGASMASATMLGSTLLPEMGKRGYSKTMALGPILGSGGLAVMIPPSGLAVLMCALGGISVGKTLIAIIIPGIMMAALYALYIIIRCARDPSLAPVYEIQSVPLSDKIVSSAKYILPMAFVIFMVIGVMILGIATPSEAAATGALSCFILAAAYRRLNWEVIKRSVTSTLRITAMIFMLITTAKVFGQILAYSGASAGLVNFAIHLPVHPIMILVAFQIIILILGCFIDSGSIMMITIPLFMPISNALGFNPVWFGVGYLINIEMAGITPPFGLTMFALKGVAPSNITMSDIYRATIPYVLLDLASIALVIVFPPISLWLPSLIK